MADRASIDRFRSIDRVMATLNLEILDAAHQDGLLPKRLTHNQNLYLHPSVLRANQIYWAIVDAELGIDFPQLEKLTELHNNTLKQFTRWLMAKGIVYAEEYDKRYVLFTQKRHRSAKKA